MPAPFDADDPWSGLAENGPLATTVADAALVLAVLAGRPEWIDLAVPDRPLRIAVCTSAGTGSPVRRDIKEVVRATADVLVAAGHDVRSGAVPYPPTLGATVLATWCVCADSCVRRLNSRQVGRPVQVHARVGRLARRMGMPRPRARRHWHERLSAFFADVDVLLTPTLAQLPPAAARWSTRGWLRNVAVAGRYSPFAAPWNLAGWPAATVPAGLHRNGVPVGVQLVAPPGGEPVLLALARQLEMHRPWPRLAPGYDVAPGGDQTTSAGLIDR